MQYCIDGYNETNTLVIWGITAACGAATNHQEIEFLSLSNGCSNDTILGKTVVCNNKRPVKEDYKFEIGKGAPKLQLKLYANDVNHLNKITNVNVKIDYKNELVHLLPNTIKLTDLGNNWNIKNTIHTNDINTRTSHFEVELEGTIPLEFQDSISLFQVDIKPALPTQGYVDSILPEYYKTIFNPIFTTNAECLQIKSAPSHINIASICAADIRMLHLYDKEFALEIIDEAINYTISFDCKVDLKIYNSLGQVVKTILSGNIQSGEYELNIFNLELMNGFYYCEMVVEGAFRKVVGIVKK